MRLNKIISNTLTILAAALLLTACAETTAPEADAVTTAAAPEGRQAERPTGGRPPPPPTPLGFFVTSVGLGHGGDLGGLAGADAHCQMLAEKVGSGNRSWRAYLSTQATATTQAVNAIDRIGKGPWGNAKGNNMAADINHLLFDNSNFNVDLVLTETGEQVNSRVLGSTPNKHDILTGTQIDGTAFAAGEDMTCNNWTSSSDDNKAMVGHSDRHRFTFPGSPWNAAHPSRGCSQKALQSSGGDGLFYCFAADSLPES